MVRGEAWYGQALSDMRGGIGQSINTLTGQEIRSAGGFAELRWQMVESFRVHVGGSLDDPRNGDVRGDNNAATGAFRNRNWTAYGGCLKDWGAGFQTGFDVIYWETEWVDTLANSNVAIGNMVRCNFYVQLNF
jgi:hypothetical protein